jgi:hypothetical protein
MEGELCYATRTSARLTVEDLPVRPHRAISVVEIKNTAKTNLTVEKLKIPTLQMSVFAAGDGQLWTETLTLERKEEDAMASVRLGKGPPRKASGAQLVRGPRSPSERGLLIRAFSGLLG